MATDLEERVRAEYGWTWDEAAKEEPIHTELDDDGIERNLSEEVFEPPAYAARTKKVPSPDTGRAGGVRYQRCGGGRRVIRRSGAI